MFAIVQIIILLAFLFAYQKKQNVATLNRMLLILLFVQLTYSLIFISFYFNSLVKDEFQKLLVNVQNPFFWQQIINAIRPLVAGWLSGGVLFGISTWFFIRRTKEKFLDRTDVMLLTIGAIAVGWPTIFIFLAVAFAFTVLGLLFLVIIRRRTLADRLVVTPFIIPAAIVTLALEPWLLIWTGLIKIRF